MPVNVVGAVYFLHKLFWNKRQQIVKGGILNIEEIHLMEEERISRRVQSIFAKTGSYSVELLLRKYTP